MSSIAVARAEKNREWRFKLAHEKMLIEILGEDRYNNPPAMPYFAPPNIVAALRIEKRGFWAALRQIFVSKPVSG